MKRKQQDALVARCLVRLDTNMIARNNKNETLRIDLVETVDFHIEEALKAKFKKISDEAKWVEANQYNLERYLGYKQKRDICCCCFEYRSLKDRKELAEFKQDNRESIDQFKNFCIQFGPFKNKEISLFEEVRDLSQAYEGHKQEYDKKQLTLGEILGTMTFQMELLRSEDEYLHIREQTLKQEFKQNEFEMLFLKEKLLHLYKLWGTLGFIDSLNFFKNFSVCLKEYVAPRKLAEAIESDRDNDGKKMNLIEDDPISNMQLLRNAKDFGYMERQLFHWIPNIILLMSIMICFCRPDFLTVLIFAMIRPLTRFRWQLEHYYSSMLAVFCLISFEILWFLRSFFL